MTQISQHRIALLAILFGGSLLFPAACWAQGDAPGARTGINAVLASQDGILVTLDSLGAKSLQTYAFKRFGILEADQLKFQLQADVQAIKAHKFANAAQQFAVVNRLVANVDRIKLIAKSDMQLAMDIAGAIVTVAQEDLSYVEYWGDVPEHQARLGKAALAASALYGAVMEEAARAQAALPLTGANPPKPVLDKWQELDDVRMTAEYSKAITDYSVVMSMDRSNKEREKIAADAVKTLAQYEDTPQIQAICRLNMGKLLMVGKADKKDMERSRQYLAQVAATAGVPWGLKYQAAYSQALGFVLTKDMANAQKEIDALHRWVTDNPPPAAIDTKLVDANMSVLEYRWHMIQYELTKDQKWYKEAVDHLQGLPPEARKKAYELLAEKQGKVANFADITDPILLVAMTVRGESEASRKTPDIAILENGLGAAREILRRVAEKKATFNPEDIEMAMFRAGYLLDKQDQPLPAGQKPDGARIARRTAVIDGYVSYLDQTKETPQNKKYRDFAHDWSKVIMGELRDYWDQAALHVVVKKGFENATNGNPYKDYDLGMMYGSMLVKDAYPEINALRANDAEKRKAILADLVKADDMLQKYLMTPQGRTSVDARYYRLLALKYQIELDADKKAELLAAVNQQAQALRPAIAAALQQPNLTQADRDKLRSLNCNIVIVVAQLIWGQQKEQGAKEVLKLMEGFEESVQGLPQAQTTLGKVLSLRVKAWQALKEPTKATEELMKLAEKSPEEAAASAKALLRDLMEDLNKAKMAKNNDGARQALASRAAVSGFMAKWYAENKNESFHKYAYVYRLFEADNRLQAALLSDDPAEKNKFLEETVTLCEDLLKPDNQQLWKSTVDEARKKAASQPAGQNQQLPVFDPTGDPTVRLITAKAYFAMEKYEKCRPIILDMLKQNKLGELQITGPDGGLIDNEEYWYGRYMLIKSSIVMAERASDAEQRKGAIDLLRASYITHPNPGGAMYHELYEKLREELPELKGWKPKFDVGVPTTAATKP